MGDATASMLANDRAAAAWWTYKPAPQVVDQMGPGEMNQVRGGAGRWIAPRAVRRVDDELQSFQQTSPRCMRSSMLSSTASTSPTAFHRKNCSTLPSELTGPVSADSTFGASLALPSMNKSSVIGFTNEVASHAPDQNASPLMVSPHRRWGANFAELAPDRSGRYAAPPPGNANNFDEWMASQASPSARRAQPLTSFPERLHAESMRQSPTPFTQGPILSPRAAYAGSAREDASPQMARRQHNNDLWLLDERPSHPRAGAAADPPLVRRGPAGPPGAGPGALWGGEQVNGGAAATAGSQGRHMSDLTKGYQTAGGVTRWMTGPAAGAREVLTDPSFPAPMPAPKDDSPAAHRRGRSDLHYMNSPRLERAEYAAREREARDRQDNFGNRRTTTTATVPSIEDERRHRELVADGGLDRMPRASTDVMPGAREREWRLQNIGDRRAQGVF